jgi:putative transposase
VSRYSTCEEVGPRLPFVRLSATMGLRLQLDDRQWRKIEAFLASRRGPGRPPKDNRMFVEAVLWWRRTGVPWRDLPEEFGPWKTVFNRFDRWSKKGVWHDLFKTLQTDVDDEWHSLDSTINRAHQHAAGGKGGPKRRRLVGRVVAGQPRSTSCSTRSDFPSLLRSQ